MATMNPGATVTLNGAGPFPCEIEMSQESETVSGTVTKPDLEWTHTDAAGHFHAFTEDGKLPTLREKRVPCDGMCGDSGHTVVAYYCRICDDPIETVWRYAREETVVPGPVHVTIRVELWESSEIGFALFQTVSVRARVGNGKELFGVGTVSEHDWTSEGPVLTLVVGFVGTRKP